jgi:hypothetical protein
LAQAHQLGGNFEEAITLYREHKDLIRENDQIQRNYINKKISECRTGQELKASPVRVWIDNLGDSINTEYPEFSPVISADNRVLFYTARRPDSEGGQQDETGSYYEDIYYSERSYGEDWSGSQNIGDPINTVSHDATVGLGTRWKISFNLSRESTVKTVTFLSRVKILTEPGKHLFLLEQQSIPNITNQVHHFHLMKKPCSLNLISRAVLDNMIFTFPIGMKRKKPGDQPSI